MLQIEIKQHPGNKEATQNKGKRKSLCVWALVSYTATLFQMSAERSNARNKLKSPMSPWWWVSSLSFMIWAKSCGATLWRWASLAGRSAKLAWSSSSGDSGERSRVTRRQNSVAARPDPYENIPMRRPTSSDAGKLPRRICYAHCETMGL